MDMELSSIRKEYKLKSLSEKEVDSSPISQFSVWFNEALEAKVDEVNAMVLSTSNQSGKPSARVVLLKDFDIKGFVFFTNYNSQKGQELSQNPYASLTFFWSQLERQIRIEGVVEKISKIDSNDYFQSRPWESRIGAWVSAQSSRIDNREQLEVSFEKFSKEFKENGIVPMPDYWGGYLLVPNYFEFWQGRPSRLHDRIGYEKKGEMWNVFRLAP